MGLKKLAWIPMFMILSAGMPILAEETEVQEPVVEQTETILGWNETHDMYTKEDGDSLRLVGKKLIKKCAVPMNKEFFNVINGSIIIMLA